MNRARPVHGLRFKPFWSRHLAITERDGTIGDD